MNFSSDFSPSSKTHTLFLHVKGFCYSLLGRDCQPGSGPQEEESLLVSHESLKVILVFGPGSSWGAGGLDLVVCSPSSSEDWPLELPCHPTWKSCWTQLIQNSTRDIFWLPGFLRLFHTYPTDVLGSAPTTSHSPLLSPN